MGFAWLVGTAPLVAWVHQESRGAIIALVVAGLILTSLVLSEFSRLRSTLIWLGAIGVAAALALDFDSTIGVASLAFSLIVSAITMRATADPAIRWSVIRHEPEVVGLSLGCVLGAVVVVIRSGIIVTPLASLLLLASAMMLAVDRLAPDISARAHRGVGHVMVRAIELLGLPVLFVALTVGAYLPGMFGASVERKRRSGREGSYWVTPRDTRAEHVIDVNRPFRREPAHVRFLRLLAACLIVPTVGLAVFHFARPTASPTPLDREGALPVDVDKRIIERGRAALSAIESTPYSSRPAFEGEPFADEMQAELEHYTFSTDPVTGYRSNVFDGKYTTVRPDGRATLDPPCDSCPSRTVWLLGGSTAFGLGQRDEHTTASELVRLADQVGFALTVKNLAVPGWTLEQELADLDQRLADPSSTQPDLVVVLDGFNDTAVSTFDEAFGRRPGASTVLDPMDSIRVLGGAGTEVSSSAAISAGRSAADRIAELSARAEQSLRIRGIGFVHFFQPDAFTTPTQSEYLATYYREAPDLLERLNLPTALETASSTLEPDVVNLRHLFDRRADPVFADMVHLNEAGGAMLGAAIWDVISPMLGH